LDIKCVTEIKGVFGGISLKLRQINWNVARNDVNVVVDELPSQIRPYTRLTLVSSNCA
jgi:hypothetical protein